MDQFITNKDKLEFRHIVLEQHKAILEIARKEFKKDNVTTITHTNYEQEVRHEDIRKCYIQAVEQLAFILLPYFDNKIQKVYDECIEIYEKCNNV